MCINASELQQFYCVNLPSITSKNDAIKVLQQLQNPFTKKERKAAVKDLITGNSFLDKGMFQLYIYEQYIDKHSSPIKKDRIHDYLLYRISKYMVQTIIALLECDTKNYDYTKNKNLIGTMALNHVSILYSWQLLYQDIQWFAQDDNRKLLTPMALFNYSFKSAYLLDYIRTNRIDYERKKDTDFVITLIAHIFNKTGQGYIKNQNTFNKNPCSLLSASNKEFRIDKIKKWSAHKEQLLIPIVTKNSKIGLIPLILCMLKRYCIVGIGYEKPHFHGGEEYDDITSVVIHDTLHFISQMIDLDHTPDKVKLFDNIYAVIQKAIKIYSSTDNDLKKLTMLKCFLSLFMITHELGSSFEYNDDIQKNATISDKLKEFLCLPDTITPTSIVTEEDCRNEELFFYLPDTFLLYQAAYPKLLDILKNNHL